MNWNNTSIKWKLVLPLPVFALVFIGLAATAIPLMLQSNVREAVIAEATQTVNQFKVIRGYYTRNVVSTVVADGNIRPSITHSTETDAIPLPATFIHEVSELLSEEDTTVSLYSAYPFPNRADRQLDSFQSDAWSFLSANPDQIYTREENIGGHQTMRVAIADRMVAEGCVSCHNSHPDTPRTGWQMGDVRGVLEVATIVDDQYAASSGTGWLIVGGAVVAMSLLMVAIYAISRSVSTPIETITGVMGRISRDDLDTDVPDLERADEIGSMARAVAVFKDNAIEKRASDEAMEERNQRAARRQASMEELVTEFDDGVGGLLGKVDTALTKLDDMSATMGDAARSSSNQAAEISTASHQTSANVQTVAAASEELSASIQEIMTLMTTSQSVSSEAGDKSAAAETAMGQLVGVADHISDVVELISGIAEQTNLLALNATIESARAGEAGKGFAVVASEVKTLAGQTASATEQISQQIVDLQQASEGAAGNIKSVVAVFEQMIEIATAVAAAMEEQTASTNEINQSVHEAARGATETSQGIVTVVQAADATSEAAEQLHSTARSLTEETTELRNRVVTFLEKIQAA
jgi:methyl-accepting chemotaxis protein